MRTLVTKEITFDCAHRLDFHKGLCHNLHGHTYKLQVTVEVAQDEFFDFNELKKRLDKVKDVFDHVTILQDTPENSDLIGTLKNMGLSVTIFRKPPTAENMAWFISEILFPDLHITSVKLWETPTSFVEVRR